MGGFPNLRLTLEGAITLQRWLASKVAIISETDLIMADIKMPHERLYYLCPCGGVDHYAARVYVEGGVSAYLSSVLSCYESGKQWAISPVRVSDVIKKEEEKFLKLLDRAQELVPKVIKKRGYSSETLFFLKDTHGIDEELSEEIWAEHR